MAMLNYPYTDYIDEYQNSLGGMEFDVLDWDRVAETLAAEHEWTDEGALHLVHLVRDYGAFVLSHAAALAVVLKQEDGEIGL
jgi:hypothetical protein